MLLQVYIRLTLLILVMLITVTGVALAVERVFPVKEQIAFVSTRDSITPNLYFLDMARGMLRPLTPDQNRVILAPAWSSDGRILAFQSLLSQDDDIYLVNYDGRDLRRITAQTAAQGGPAWSPDNRQIAYYSGSINQADIFILDVASGESRQLTSTPGMELNPAWSPDGRYIAFAANLNGSINIFRVDVLAARENSCAPDCPFTQVTHGAIWDNHPVFSPDGTQLLYVSDVGANREIMLLELACLELAEGCADYLHNLSQSGGDDSEPDWSPDGRRVIFYSQRGYSRYSQLYMVDADCYQYEEGCLARTRRIINSDFDTWSPVWWP